ncbi:XdhC family aldehyde oxidoreductase maturation factor [Desulfotalea psychrophila]|uniref:Xanthine dehydrogenase accessory factor n=1 Tax=Desulfotalea psychrophila (strain LSv54 / DSM 12343) TaxID=177439 RepID=Q6ARN3_DESPS|nr:XdhC/CoxI family protein [Desulfotalea psychrophila]CAG34992.1 conserved hypothetical protein [Desulfotalea psychrophila LSv54]
MKAFVRSLCELIEQGEPCVLATVLESSGSTPRSSGAKMVVRAQHTAIGTIGGGIVEAIACRDARRMLEDCKDGRAELTFTDMDQEMAANSDMICGGNLSVLLETIESTGPCALAYRELDGLLRRGERAVLSTTFSKGDSLCSVGHEVMLGDYSALAGQAMEKESPCFSKSETELCFAEPFIPPAPLYIFGAGHVSLFTARVGAMLGFRTVVLDDRDDFANVERFPTVDEVRVLASFEDCCTDLSIPEDAYIIIVTRGHVHDLTVLGDALKTDARYIGMIGSKKKRNAIYDALLADGVSQANIDRCHSPIGLTIGAQTPEEISVSIAAELIGVRAKTLL